MNEFEIQLHSNCVAIGDFPLIPDSQLPQISVLLAKGAPFFGEQDLVAMELVAVINDPRSIADL